MPLKVLTGSVVAEYDPTEEFLVVTGFYSASIGNGNHGFLRAVGGTFTSIDFPDTPGSSSTVIITQSFAINPAKTVTGFYIDSSGGTHGFLRTFSNMYAS